MARNTSRTDEALKTSSRFSLLRRCTPYIKEQGGILLGALGINIVSILLTMLLPTFTRLAIDDCIPQKDIPRLFLLGGLYLGVLAVTHLANYLQGRIIARAGQNIVFSLRADLYEHLQKLPLSYFDSRPHGKIMVRVVNYVNSVATFLSSGVVTMLVQILTVFAIGIFMFGTNVPLSLITLAGLPVVATVVLLLKRKLRKALRAVNDKSSNLNAFVGEHISGVRLSQAFTRQAENETQYEELARSYQQKKVSSVRLMLLSGPTCAEIVSFGVTCLIYYFSGSVIAGISVGVILAMADYSTRFWQPIRIIAEQYNNLADTASYLERIFELMDEPISVDDAEDAVTLGEVRGEVVFDRVGFGYEDGPAVLKDLTLTVKPGENIALVGPTGAGKTTVVSLISRFYDVQSGSVCIDGTDVRKIAQRSLRQAVSVMLQEPYLFSGTVRDNIRYGAPEADDERVVAAAKAVHAHDFILSLPKGYDTRIGENGGALSAGQRQLIAFARTLLSDPRILILDEATSAIDTQTELLLQEGIRALMKGRTCFVIAHRLSTIRDCDRICCIADGHIAESGTHDELMEKRGLYYDLQTAQHRDL